MDGGEYQRWTSTNQTVGAVGQVSGSHGTRRVDFESWEVTCSTRWNKIVYD